MCTITGSFGRDCVLVILFQHYGARLSFLKVIYSRLVSMTPSPTPHPKLHIERRTNPILIYLHTIFKQPI